MIHRNRRDHGKFYMSDPKLTLGKAIDQIIEALATFDDRGKKTVLSTVCSHLKIDIAQTPTTTPTAAGLPRPDSLTPPPSPPPLHTRVHATTDIRTLKEQKKPNSARQMACL